MQPTSGSPDRPARALADVFFWIGAAAGVALLAGACRSLADLASEAQAQAVTDEVADIVHAKSIAVDLGYYEDPAAIRQFTGASGCSSRNFVRP